MSKGLWSLLSVRRSRAFNLIKYRNKGVVLHSAGSKEFMSVSSLKVKIFDNGGTQVVAVPKSNLTIGSAKHCDVVLAHESVQPEHLRAWFDGGRIWIQDMGSTNGTFLNGIRLPQLKPMLVRELDVLKLGENPSTLGLEANMVRAPVVRPQAPIDETTAPGKQPVIKDSDLEKKRDELAKIRRELAELKLQLQMGRLDKDSEDEAHRQLSVMRNEMNGLNEQRTKLERNIRQMEQQRQSQLAAVDNEINERKSSAMNQLKNLMDHEMSKLADWKMQVMADIRRDIHSISQSKAKSWITRPLSNDMMLEWESEIQTMLRRVLLGELPEAEVLVEEAAPAVPVAPKKGKSEKPGKHEKHKAKEEALHSRFSLHSTSGTRTNIISSDNSGTAYTPVPRSKRRASLGKGGDSIKFILMLVFAAGLVAVAVLFKKGLLPFKDRSLAGSLDNSSIQPLGNKGASIPKRKYEPVMTKNFKKNYTDNTLFTMDFIDSELNATYRSQWLADLNKAATVDWKMDVNTPKVIADKELMLLQDLKRMRDGMDPANEQAGITAMRERESYFQKELDTLLKGKPLTDKYVRLKRSFFARTLGKKQ